jgi:L-lactate dehydrogenase (cytochrome)
MISSACDAVHGMREAASVSDYRALAKARLPHFLFEYLDGGSYDEVTLRRNVEDLQSVALKQRVLRDVSNIDLSTELFGKRWQLPVGLGPVGLSGLYARRGEVQAAKAAAAAGIALALSTLSACSIDEVAKGAGPGFWFQLYIVKDRAFVSDMIARAREAGCGALVLTVDLAVPGTRYRDYRSGLSGSIRGKASRMQQVIARPDWAWDVAVRGKPMTLGNLEPLLGSGAALEDLMGWVAKNFDASVTWKDVEWVRDQWKGPLVIKGILDPDDAREAVAHGTDGIVVSNHGGRQLDGALSTARALPSISDAVAGRMPVLADGGVRSGLDVVRMLALGADFVLMGRAWAYALAARGGAGVAHVLKLIDAEMRVAMALTGCASVDQIGEQILEKGGNQATL